MKKKLLTALLAGVLTVSGMGTLPQVFAAETDTMVKSYLTGLDVPESVGRRRPVAVMIDNIENAVPQSGIGNAGVVYEAPVEGEITRLMAVLEDYDGLEKIGPVRSCRDYYLYYANEFNSIYCHYGQADFALPYFEQNVIDHLNGINLGSTAYYRTSDRPAPHNAYTSFDLLQNGIASQNYSQEYKEGYDGHYLFAPEGQKTVLENGVDANVVKFENFTYNHPWFEYDAASGEYKRFQYGGAQIDEVTGEQLTCTNILVQYSSYPKYEGSEYLNVDAVSGGAGKFITGGKAIDIQWSKDSDWGITHYYDADGQEVQLNPGVTWVEIVQNDRGDSILFQ